MDRVRLGLCLQQKGGAILEIHLSPPEPDSLPDAGAGLTHEQPDRGDVYQVVLVALPEEGMEPGRRGGLFSLRRPFLEILDLDVIAPSAVTGVVDDCPGRRYRLAVPGRIAVDREDGFCHFSDIEWLDRRDRHVCKMIEDRL